MMALVDLWWAFSIAIIDIILLKLNFFTACKWILFLLPINYNIYYSTVLHDQMGLARLRTIQIEVHKKSEKNQKPVLGKPDFFKTRFTIRYGLRKKRFLLNFGTFNYIYLILSGYMFSYMKASKWYIMCSKWRMYEWDIDTQKWVFGMKNWKNK